MSRPLTIADMCGQDTGGQSFNLSRAINKFTPHTSRSFRRSADYLDFPFDIQLGQHDHQEVKKFLATVDVVHVHGMYRRANGWAPINPKAKWIIHQHGRVPRRSKAVDDALLAADIVRGARRMVSTLNLLGRVGYDQDRWIPAPMDLESFSSLKRRLFEPDRDEVLVAHSPTRRDYKGTEHIANSVAALQKDGLKVRLVLIEKQSHARCLRQRARCDITYDQMHLCYGNSGLEGMAFSQPAIVGMADAVRATVRDVVGCDPYVFASPETLTEVLRRLVVDVDYRKRCGEIGRLYVERFHDHQVVATRMAALYEKLCDPPRTRGRRAK